MLAEQQRRARQEASPEVEEQDQPLAEWHKQQIQSNHTQPHAQTKKRKQQTKKQKNASHQQMRTPNKDSGGGAVGFKSPMLGGSAGDDSPMITPQALSVEEAVVSTFAQDMRRFVRACLFVRLCVC